jgi:hypothetical protein
VAAVAVSGDRPDSTIDASVGVMNPDAESAADAPAEEPARLRCCSNKPG